MHIMNQIGFLLQHLSFGLVRQNDQLLQERMGIGFSQFKILRVLEAQPHIQQNQIADALGQTEASISRQIKLLHERGLLQTTINPKNRRKHITTLTPKGMRFTEEAINILRVYHQPMFDQLTAKQQEQLLELLQTLHDHGCSGGILGACRQFANPPSNT